MTIGELATQSEVPASTIRYYERIGVLPVPERISGQRRYSRAAVHRLAVLRLAQACGFRLDEMRQLISGFRPGIPASRRWQELAHRKRAELALEAERVRAIQKLLDRVLQCRCADLDECGPPPYRSACRAIVSLRTLYDFSMTS